jgi:hypothetical protein
VGDESRSEELTERVLAAVSEQVRELAAWLVDQREANLRDLEGGLTRQGHRVLTRMLEVVWAARASDGRRTGAWCREWGGAATWYPARSKTVHLLLGDVQVARDYAYCATCRQGWAPLDAALGIDQRGRSPRLVETVALLGTEVSFGAAAQRLEQICEVWLSPSQVETVTEGIGQTLAAEHEAAATAALDPRAAPVPEVLDRGEAELPWLVVMLDGVYAPLRDGVTAVQVAALTRAGPGLDPAAGRKPRLGRWRYVVETTDLARFGRLVWYEAQRLGAARVSRIRVIADGAAWIWKLADRSFLKHQGILDSWHAVQHLWSLGTARFGDHDPRVKAWVGRAKSRLRQGEIERLLVGWERVAPADAAVWAEALTSFRNQAPRLASDLARHAGMPIGSGAPSCVGASCANRHVVGLRVKQAGRHWTEPGLRGVLALRSLLRSGDCDSTWDAHPLPLKLAC